MALNPAGKVAGYKLAGVVGAGISGQFCHFDFTITLK